MKAISLWQPWASLMALGLKVVETRHWSTSYRGPLVIHAAQHVERVDPAAFSGWLDAVAKRAEPGTAAAIARLRAGEGRKLPRGAFLSVHDLVGCLPTAGFRPGLVEELLGNYTPGRYAWVTTNRRELATPIPAKGLQGGPWRLEADQLAAVTAALNENTTP